MLMRLHCQASCSTDGRYVGAGSAVDGVHIWTVMDPDLCSSLYVCMSILAPGMTAGGHVHPLTLHGIPNQLQATL